jgi:hypothetical protein
VTLRAGDRKSSLGDAKSSLGDAKRSLGDAKLSLGDVKALPASRALRASCATEHVKDVMLVGGGGAGGAADGACVLRGLRLNSGLAALGVASPTLHAEVSPTRSTEGCSAPYTSLHQRAILCTRIRQQRPLYVPVAAAYTRQNKYGLAWGLVPLPSDFDGRLTSRAQLPPSPPETLLHTPSLTPGVPSRRFL